MSKKNKKNQNFNFYWIYAGIALLFILLQLFNTISSPLKKINKQKFLTEFLIENEVEKVTIVNNEFVEVFIKKNKLEQGKHQAIIKQNQGRLNKGPHYYFNITSGEQFENDLKDFYKKNNHITLNDQIVPDVDTRKDIFGDVIGWIIPLVIMLGIWIYIMKRMSGGGAPGGTIFNIGKSKAELFDKDTKEKTNFNDVAGLEGAKEEVKEIVDFKPKKYTH